ncbi:MAG: PhzF family phenazine biosynthesis protein [Cyclobacteriaceae bacterium]
MAPQDQASYVLLDVFTSTKYGGNQLAIFPDASSIDPSLFQSIARELNLSETVFLFPPQTDGEHHAMRIFTPGQELPTAGHPTIGTAYYLSRQIEPPENGRVTISLIQKIGIIPVEIDYSNNAPDMITMSQPLPYFGPVHDEKRQVLADALSLSVDDFSSSPIQEISCGNNTILVQLKSLTALAKCELNPVLWKTIKPQVNDAFLYVFTLEGVSDGDVQGRMFAPEIGIMEDPATGSANGPLICYLTKYGLAKGSIISLQGYEMGRPSQLFVEAITNQVGEIIEVKVGGKCVETGKGVHYI